MAEFEMKQNSSEDEAERIRIIKFIQSNPDKKRSNVMCPEHGEGPVIITDNGPGQSIFFTACCMSAIDKRRGVINSLGAWNEVLGGNESKLD